MLGETITSTKPTTHACGREGSSSTTSGNGAASSGKSASIMMIRIPRSAAASPRASAETIPNGAEETVACDPPFDAATIAKATETPKDRLTSQRSGPSHWSDAAPDGVSANNNKAAPMIDEPLNPSAPGDKIHAQARPMSLLATTSSPCHADNNGLHSKQHLDQGALEQLPKKASDQCIITDERGPMLAIELQPKYLSDKDVHKGSLNLQGRTGYAGRHPRHPGAYLGCITYEPFQFPLAIQHPDYGSGATFDVSLPLDLLRQEKHSLAIGERPSSATLRRRCLWGGGSVNEHLYTDDSDPLCILLHSCKDLNQSGGSRRTEAGEEDLASLLTSSTQSALPKHVRATFQIFPCRQRYQGVPGNASLRSRSWRHHSGLSVRLLGVRAAPPLASRKGERGSSLLRASNLGPHEGCSLRFSSHSGAPLLSFSDLLYLPVVIKKRLGAGHALYLLGNHRQNQYILEQVNGEERAETGGGKRTADGGKRAGSHSHHPPAPRYRLCRGSTGSTETLEGNTLFDDLAWEEIRWREGGLSIRSTFLNLTGYHW